jgi:hypothetical protein
MLEYLEAYLDASTTPELRALIMDSCKTLDTAGVDSHHFLLRQAIDGADGLEFDVVYSGIFGTLKPIFMHTLLEFGITVDEEIDLRSLNSILKGLQAVTNWSDPDTLNGLADTAQLEGNEAALADILEITSDLSAGEYLGVIVEVSTDLIQRISEVTNRDIGGPQPNDIAVAAAQTRLRPLIEKAGFGEDSIFVNALDNGLRLGLSFELTFEPYLDQLHQLPVNRLAAELVAFAYASSAQTDAVPMLLNKLKESFTLSITDLMQLDSAIKHLL